MRVGVLGDLLDEADVVRPEPDPHLRSRPDGLEHGDAQGEVVGVDIVATLVGDGGRLRVGTLDEPDLGIERQQALDVGRGASEVRLEADPGVRVDRLEALVERDRSLGVGAALHVHPEGPAGLGRLRGQRRCVLERPLDIEIEAELGQLHADLAIEPSLVDLVHDAEVVGRHLVGLLDVGEVLAEARVEGSDPLDLKGRAGGHGAVCRLAGHEPPDCPLREPEPRQVITKPRVAGHPEQQGSHGAQAIRFATRPQRLAVGVVDDPPDEPVRSAAQLKSLSRVVEGPAL